MRDTKATFLDLVLAPGTYVFRVRAGNSSYQRTGYSSWSEPSAEYVLGSEAETEKEFKAQAEPVAEAVQKLKDFLSDLGYL